jgi:hypothetical protein
VSYRLPEGATKAYFESKREFEKLSLSEGMIQDDISDNWEYGGACVTKGFAEKVMIPSGYEIK